MLAKKYKIGQSERIEQIFLKGRRLSGRILQFRLLSNRAGITRFAIVMKKNMTKTAVARNRLRRRVYEAIRKNLPHDFETGKLPKPCYDVVVLLSRRATDAAYKDIENDIIPLLQRL